MPQFKHFWLVGLIVILSLAYRWSGLRSVTPFWVDEFATASQAQLILKHGLAVFSQSVDHFEYHNITTHALTALSFQIFGQNESTARLPSLIFGSLVPVLVFLLSKKLFKSNIIALSAGLLTALSYFQITWSLQARSYSLQQFLLLATLLVYLKLGQTRSKMNTALLLVLILLGLLTHTTYWLVLMALALHFLLFHWRQLNQSAKQPWLWLLLPILGLSLVLSGSYKNILDLLLGLIKNGLVNNVWYYHSFLWRQYGLISFLGLFGWLVYWFKNKPSASLIWMLLLAYLSFVCFGFAPYVSRYLLPIFPLLLMGTAYSLVKMAQMLPLPQSSVKKWLPLILTLAVIMNGHKFVIKPQAYYSVNHDMREIAVVDYDQVYRIIRAKIAATHQRVAVIETWAPRALWYLGQDYLPLYWFRWINEEGSINGIGKATQYDLNSGGEKIMPKSGSVPIGFVGELSDLLAILDKYNQGFIWIDDTSRPKEVIQYAQDHFTKELELTAYPLEAIENPYSVWPGSLYSWGFEQ